MLHMRRTMGKGPLPSYVCFTHLLLLLLPLRAIHGVTDGQDAAALRALMDNMKNTPPSWGKSNDPCGTTPWDGLTCNNSRVVELKLFNMGLEGTLSGDIGSLTELRTLDLSYNKKLGGVLTPAIGKLKQLTALMLIGCSFTGNIPTELGNLANLKFLALNSNQFTGEIPASLGSLSKLFWLDLAENQLTGPLPVSTSTTSGLDQLYCAFHFHLNKNQLSGSIPEDLFSSKLIVRHVLLDRNNFTGSIPASIGFVKNLTILRLDNNSLSGSVPSNINNLTQLSVLNLANNKLIGAMPNLTGMNALSSVDLSDNLFDPAEAPTWISQIQSLTSLVISSGNLQGQVPQKLFSFPQLQQVIMDGNSFNGSLDMGSNISPQLQTVSFKDNDLSSVELSSGYNNTIILSGNPVCSNVHLSGTGYCLLEKETTTPYLTSWADCNPQSCPQKYNCSNPYKGMMVFRAPFFQDVTNDSVFESLKVSVREKFGSKVDSISLENPYFDGDHYLQVELKLCPSNGTYFNRTEVLVELDLSSQNYQAPQNFGPFYFNATSYSFQGGRSSKNKGLTIGLAVGCILLVLGLLGVAFYAFRQKKRAQRAIEISNPFASWVSTGEDDGGAPQVRGAKCFSFDELKKYTNNFPEINEIGSGGYGKVYRGMLPDGQIVAIKRSQVGSSQGGLEFKTEIELLSRVHHKNLVALVGFCFSQGERMLVYEYISNGTLGENLSGKRGTQMDWKRRLLIALGSARGLAYLHEHADPPIIHRDVKSANILLDESLNPKVADFGLSKSGSEAEVGHVSTQVKGTLGYLDPEYYMTQQLTEKSDVYSFGIVMLELVTARPPIHKGQYIVREVKGAIDEKDEEYFGLMKVMDPVIRDARNLIGFRRFIEIALQCVEESSVDRPSMSDIVKEIETMLRKCGVDTSTSSSFGIQKVPQLKSNGHMQRKDVSTDSISSSFFSSSSSAGHKYSF